MDAYVVGSWGKRRYVELVYSGVRPQHCVLQHEHAVVAGLEDGLPTFVAVRGVTMTLRVKYALANDVMIIGHYVAMYRGVLSNSRFTIPRAKLYEVEHRFNYEHADHDQVCDLTFQTYRTERDVLGQPIERVPYGGAVWYHDLSDWTPHKAKMYDLDERRLVWLGDGSERRPWRLPF